MTDEHSRAPGDQSARDQATKMAKVQERRLAAKVEGKNLPKIKLEGDIPTDSELEGQTSPETKMEFEMETKEALITEGATDAKEASPPTPSQPLEEPRQKQTAVKRAVIKQSAGMTFQNLSEGGGGAAGSRHPRIPSNIR